MSIEGFDPMRIEGFDPMRTEGGDLELGSLVLLFEGVLLVLIQLL